MFRTVPFLISFMAFMTEDIRLYSWLDFWSKFWNAVLAI